jgi:hypothetical protein
MCDYETVRSFTLEYKSVLVLVASLCDSQKRVNIRAKNPVVVFLKITITCGLVKVKHWNSLYPV